MGERIPLSADQFLHLCTTAAPLAEAARGAYAADVHARLLGRPIGDGAVGCAIRDAFGAYFTPPEIPGGAGSSWSGKGARPSKARDGVPIEADRGPGGRPLKGLG